jgi:diguanylate cyclase (GGDEF)-like protein/PAS domain S-box-containing protein
VTITPKTRLELDEERRRLSAALMQSEEAVALTNAEARYIYANPAFCKLFGYELDELIGNHISLLMPPGENSGSNVQQTTAAAREQGAFHGEVRRRAKDGSIIPILLKVSPFRDEQGKLTGYIATMTDLTEIKRMEDALRESEKHFREIIEHAPLGMTTVTLDGRFIQVNQAFCDIVGYQKDELKNLSFGAITHPDDINISLENIQKLIAGEIDSYRIEKRYFHKDGHIVWAQVDTSIQRIPAEGPEFLICQIKDFTEQMRAEELLLKQKQFSDDIINSLPGIFYMLNQQGQFIRVNPQLMEVSGYSKDELGRMTALDLFDGEDKKRIAQKMQEGFEKGNAMVEAELIIKSGQKIPYYFTGRRTSIDGQLYLVGLGTDITEKKQAEEHIQRLAHFDQLTGLPNRTLLNDHFKYALSLAQRSGETFAVMFLDLDHFKDINDTLGHSIGDRLLMEVAKRLKDALREADTLSRQGGDDFILILPGINSDGAALVAANLIEVVSRPCFIEQHELITTPSIGIAIYPHDGENMELLSKSADAAMYRAKNEGRNDFRFFTPEMQTQSARNLTMANALRHALARNELQLHYQPQLSLQDGHIVGAEALLRWQHPDLGMIAPAEFIPIAENTGQIIQIGEWVLRTAIKQLKDWMDGGLSPMVMAVNLSAVQFRQHDLPELVVRILDEAKLPHEYLELELTEASTMDNPQAAIAVMNKLHERGIRMSIDDFGTGYSSLSYLKKFKVYKLKIDQSFVRDITDDPDDKAIVTAIINMASSLGMQTIAEGVETAGQLAFLRLQGCNEVQGYYFSKPLTVAQFEEFAKQS